MQTIVKNKFQQIFYSNSQKFLFQIWKKRTVVMFDNEFKKEMLLFFKQIKKNKIDKLLIDMREFFYIVIPEMQVWIDKNVNNYIEKQGLKVAYVMSPDDFTKISVNQTLEENAGMEMHKEIFEDIEDAKKFLAIDF